MTENIIIKFDGTIFEQGFDLRDISFLSKKISNILDKSYLSCTGNYTKSKDLRKKYKLTTKNIKHSSLELELLLDFGLALSPILSTEPLTVSEIMIKAIEKTIELGKKYKKDDKPYHNAEKSTITHITLEINGDNNNVNIPNSVYNGMLHMDSDLKDIAGKINKDELNSLEINENEVINKNNLKYLEQGIKHIEELKEEMLDVIYSAKIKVYEFNKQNLTGKAFIVSIDKLIAIECKEIVDLDIPSSMEDEIINSLVGNSIDIKFKPIIENQVSKRILKKMILK